MDVLSHAGSKLLRWAAALASRCWRRADDFFNVLVWRVARTACAGLLEVAYMNK
jgi:hypothetical protein